MDVILIGTGTSSSVPNFMCISHASNNNCTVCKSAAVPIAIEGNSVRYSKNKRRNTSAVVRYKHSDGSIKNIVIDCGKTFYDASLAWFPEHGLVQIDAILLTHGHADAVFGLDDLRMWTSGYPEERLQQTVQIYSDAETLKVIESAFPYICDGKKATGSGDVSAVQFTLFDTTPFELFGELEVIPFKGSKILFIDALRLTHHVSHFGYSQALAACYEILAKGGNGYFTGMGHYLDHDEIQKWIDENIDKSKQINVSVAYDGQVVTE